MVTWKPLESAVHALRYFRRDWEFLRLTRYFSGDPATDRRERRWRRLATRWHGQAAAALGLRGPVKAARFEEVLEGRVPGTDLRLGRIRRGAAPTRAGTRRAHPCASDATSRKPSAAPLRQHRPGGDLTFSAPKSVSLEALVYARPRTRARVLRAHDEAVREALDFVERELLQTRSYDSATGRRPRIAAHGLVAATFRHIASRDLDPQLHTHAVLLNMTRDASGAWRGAEFTALSRARLLVGAVYRTALQHRLEGLGYATVPTLVGTTPGFEIAGYPMPLLDHFSQRRRAILDWIERQGHAYSTRTAQLAALVTRRQKREPTRSELDALWSDRSRAYGPPRDWETARGRSGPPPAPVPPAREVVRRALEHLEERQTVFSRNQIRGWALAHAGGRHDLAALDRALHDLERRERRLVPVAFARLDAAYTTRRALAEESAILKRVAAGRAAGQPLADVPRARERLTAGRLNPGQRAAAELVLLSSHRIVGVQGHAGSGKTTMLRAVVELAGDRPVLALAPSAAAARILAAETGVRVRTLQWFLTRFRTIGEGTATPAESAAAHEKLAGALVVVDEASMIGNAAMGLLLRIAHRADVARVALIGDRRQLSSVAAGQPFRLMQDRGLPTATMHVILRQRTPGLRAVVQHLLARKPGLAIDGLGADMLEVDGAEEGTTAEAAARLWLDLEPAARTRTAIVAPTHAERAEIASVIRAALAADGGLRGGTLTIDRYVNLHLTRAEKGEPAHYRPGDIAIFHADLRHVRVRKDDACTVRAIAGDQVLLGHPDGTERRIRPASQIRYRLELYEPRPIDLRAGDRIRWTRNWQRHGLDLDNGMLATVAGIDRNRVRFRGDDGRTYSLARDHPQLHHLDHAYSTTVHGAQGMTCDAVIAVLDAGRGAPPDQAALYVELTRARDSAVLLTDDREALVEALEARTGEERSALEAVAARPSAGRRPARLAGKPGLLPEPIVWDAFADAARARGEHPFGSPGHQAALDPLLALAERAPDTAPAVVHRTVEAHRTWIADLARHAAHEVRRKALESCTGELAACLDAREALLADRSRGTTATSALAEYATLQVRADAAIAAATALQQSPSPARGAVTHHADLMVALEQTLQRVRHTQRLDARAAECCRRLDALNREAAATGIHRYYGADYRPLTAAIRNLATGEAPADPLVPVLADVLAEGDRLDAAGAELRAYVTLRVPTFVDLYARFEAGARARNRGILETEWTLAALLHGNGELFQPGMPTITEQFLSRARFRPHLDACPGLATWLREVDAATSGALAFDLRAHRVLARLRRLQNTTDSVEAPIHAPGAGRIVAAVRRLAAERPGLPRMPKSAVPPALPPFPANHPHDPRWQQSPIPYSDALATRIPQPLVQFRRAYLRAWSDRMALRKQLAGEIAGLERLLADRRRWSHALPGEDAAVRRTYADWADRCRQVPLPGDRAGLEPVAAADDAERGLRREALWARIGVLRAELRRVLAQDRRADRDIRTFVESMPVLLEDRTRLEPAVLDLDQHARIQGQPGYHAWRTQAQAAIRTGTALRETGTTAELLHAGPGRHARVAGAIALLADMLVLDDRVQALGRHGGDLDRSADRRVRTFVLETIPAVLADRARLEHTAGDRAGRAGIQEEPDDTAWRQRADHGIRTGTALLDSKRMAALLDAVPGRRAGITNAVALLADTLVLDDRVQALGRHGGDLDRHADRRVRTFVLETIPAVLADRARLERTAGDRAGMAGIQEEPDYAAWRQRADPVVRTGTALLDSKRMAALLDAEPDRRAVIGSAAACLRDTLVLDDRAHTRLLYDRDGIHPTDAAGAGSPPTTAPLRPVLTELRELVETAERLRSRQPVLPAPESARLAPGPGAPGGAGPVPAALTPEPSGTLPPPIAAMLRDAGERRARQFARLVAEDLPRLQALVNRREEIRRAAVAASADVSTDPEYDQWRTAAITASWQAIIQLDGFEPWLAAYHPASPAAETARHDVAATEATLAGARARDATAAECVADLGRHAQDAVSEGKPPYAGPAYVALVGRIRDCRESALPGECPPLLAAVAERPEALQAGHARVWRLGTCVLPDLEGRLRTRAELCAVAHAQESSVTEMPGYGDWDRQAEDAARPVPEDSAPEDPLSEWHWHTVHSSPRGERAQDRLAAATSEIARAVRIDREVRVLLADPLRPTDQAQPPWVEPARAADVPRYKDYVKRIRTLHTGAGRAGEMPPSLLRTAQAFETWMRDRAVVTEHVATIRSGLRRSRQLLAEAGDSNAPFRDDRGADYQNWLGELRRIKRAATALQRDLPRYRAHMRAIGFRDREWGARRRIAGLLPHLDRTPAGRLLQLHDAIANAPASAPVWLGSAAAGSVVRAWQDMARNNDPTGAGTGARTPPAPIRHLEEGRALHEHAGRIRFLAEHYRDMGAGHWLWDPMDSTWPDQVDRNITAAGNFLGDPGTLERLEQHFPDSTAALSKDLAIVSAAFAAHQERQRERSRTTQETPSRGSPGPPQTGAWSAGPTSGIDGSRSAPTDRRPRPARPPAPGASSRRGGGLDR